MYIKIKMYYIESDCPSCNSQLYQLDIGFYVCHVCGFYEIEKVFIRQLKIDSPYLFEDGYLEKEDN